MTSTVLFQTAALVLKACPRFFQARQREIVSRDQIFGYFHQLGKSMHHWRYPSLRALTKQSFEVKTKEVDFQSSGKASTGVWVELYRWRIVLNHQFPMVGYRREDYKRCAAFVNDVPRIVVVCVERVQVLSLFISCSGTPSKRENASAKQKKRNLRSMD